MSNNHNRTELKAREQAHRRTQTPKKSLLLSFIIFMAWVAAGGLLLSLIGHALVAHSKTIATDTNSGYDSPTTKLLAVKPNRHSLAIFVPKICLTTNQKINKSMNKNTSALQASHVYSIGHSAIHYGGLIKPNKIPFMGNKLSRLVTVVETRPPLFVGEIKLTKLLGVIHHG